MVAVSETRGPGETQLETDRRKINLRLDRIKYYRNKVDRLAVGIPEVVAKWRQTFGV